MKNSKLFKTIFSFFFMISFVLFFVSCVTIKVKVTFEAEGSVVEVVSVEKGKTMTEDQVPAAPEIENARFVGWFNGEEEFSIEKICDSDVTYVAKYIRSYQVEFIANEKVVAQEFIEEGQKYGKAPEAPVVEGYDFVGWFNGEVEYSPETSITENVSYVAKYTKQPEIFTLTFKVGEEVVKEASVQEGQKIAVTEVPSEPSLKAYRFVGWFNGEKEFNEEEVVSESATYVAKFERSHYVVTFGEGETAQEVLVEVEGTLSIAGVEAPSQSEAFFAGWFSGETKAVEGLVVTSDMTFVAKFVTLASFNGLWASNDGSWFSIEDGVVSNATFGEAGKTFTFDVNTGKLAYEASSRPVNKHAFAVTEAGLEYTHEYYDDIYEEMASDTYALVVKEATGYEGTYQSDKTTVITIANGGIVTKYDGQITKLGIVAETESGLEIRYQTASTSSTKKVALVFDEKGNLVVNGKIYVKNVSSYTYLYANSSAPIINFYVTSEETVVVVKEGNSYYYGVTEGVVAVDEFVTVTYNEKEILIKVTGTTSYVLAGEERGTYTEGEKTLVLNGFGNATVDGVEATYTISAKGYIIVGEAGYEINQETHTFTTLVKDSVNTGKYTLNGNTKYVLMFDGFGGATLKYSTSTVYKGTYTVSGNKITIKDVNYYANGTWTVEEEGNVLVNGSKIYLLDGATFSDHKEELNGVYGDAGQIVVVTGKVSVEGTEYSLTYNYNGTKATYEVSHVDESIYGVEATFTDVITLSLSSEGKLIVSNAHTTWDEYGEGPETTTIVTEYEQYSAPTLDAYAGTWTGNKMTFVFNGDGTGTVDGSSITYTISNSKLSFLYAGYLQYEISGDPATNSLTASWEDLDEGYTGSFAIVREGASEPSLDVFAGTWTGNGMTFVFNGDGTGVFNGNAINYVIENGVLTFNVNYVLYYTISGDPKTGTLRAEWEDDDYNGSSFNITKQA